MPRFRTIAALVGLIAGAWVLWGSYYGTIGRGQFCPYGAGTCTGPASLPPANIFVVSLAVLLVLDSALSLVGPRIAFYASAGISILLGGSIVPSSSLVDPTVIVALGLAASTCVLGLVAARRRTEVSEQSHPMNLPVFG